MLIISLSPFGKNSFISKVFQHVISLTYEHVLFSKASHVDMLTLFKRSLLFLYFHFFALISSPWYGLSSWVQEEEKHKISIMQKKMTLITISKHLHLKKIHQVCNISWRIFIQITNKKLMTKYS